MNLNLSSCLHNSVRWVLKSQSLNGGQVPCLGLRIEERRTWYRQMNRIANFSSDGGAQNGLWICSQSFLHIGKRCDGCQFLGCQGRWVKFRRFCRQKSYFLQNIGELCC